MPSCILALFAVPLARARRFENLCTVLHCTLSMNRTPPHFNEHSPRCVRIKIEKNHVHLGFTFIKHEAMYDAKQKVISAFYGCMAINLFCAVAMGNGERTGQEHAFS